MKRYGRIIELMTFIDEPLITTRTVTKVRSIKKGYWAGCVKVWFNGWDENQWLILYKSTYDSIMEYLGKRYLKGTEMTLKCPCVYCYRGLDCIKTIVVKGREFTIHVLCPLRH